MIFLAHFKQHLQELVRIKFRRAVYLVYWFFSEGVKLKSQHGPLWFDNGSVCLPPHTYLRCLWFSWNVADFTGGRASLIMQQQSSVSGEQSVTSGATCTSSPAKTGTQTSSMFPLTYIVPFTLLRAIETLAAVTAVVEVGFCARLKWVLIDCNRNCKKHKWRVNKQNFWNQPINLANEQECNYKKVFSQRKVI